MEVGHVHVQGIARNFGVVPVDGEGDGCVAKHAEVERVMSVFPNVLAAEDEVFAQSLLEAGVEFVAEAGDFGCRDARQCRRARERGRCWRSPGWRGRGSR